MTHAFYINKLKVFLTLLASCLFLAALIYPLWDQGVLNPFRETFIHRSLSVQRVGIFEKIALIVFIFVMSLIPCFLISLLIRLKPFMRVDEIGIHYYRNQTVAWSHITGVRQYDLQSFKNPMLHVAAMRSLGVRLPAFRGQFLVIDLAEPDEYIRRFSCWRRLLMKSNAKLSGSPLCIATCWLTSPLKTVWEEVNLAFHHYKRTST